MSAGCPRAMRPFRSRLKDAVVMLAIVLMMAFQVSMCAHSCSRQATAIAARGGK